MDKSKSFEWFCTPELIKIYEFWDCKNLQKYRPSQLEINAAKGKLQDIKNLPTNALMKVAKEVREIHKNSPTQRALDAFKDETEQLRILVIPITCSGFIRSPGLGDCQGTCRLNKLTHAATIISS